MEKEQKEEFMKKFEKHIVRDDEGNPVGLHPDAFKHFTPIMTPDRSIFLKIATFDGGDKGDVEAYKEALEEKLQYLVTVAEYNYMETTGNKYMPYTVMQPSEVPEEFQLALDKEEDYGDRTNVIIRAFQKDDNGNYNPVQLDLQGDEDGE